MKIKMMIFLMFFSMPLLAHATGYELSIVGQNTGIGTASPLATLGVGGNLSVGSATYTNVAPPTNGVIIQGNVGIGSLAPGQALDVGGTIRSIGLVTTQNVGIGTGHPNYTLDVNGSMRVAGAGTNTFSGNLGIGQALPLSLLDVNGGVAVGSYSGVNPAPSNNLIISGNLGVGTYNPQNTIQLDSSGNTYFGIDSGAAGNSKFKFFSQGNIKYYVGWDNTVQGWILANQGSTVLLAANLTNIGINSSFPGSTLDVQGTVNQIRLIGNVGIGTGVPAVGSTLTIGGKCLGLSGDMYLDASGHVNICTSGTFPACSVSVVC